MRIFCSLLIFISCQQLAAKTPMADAKLSAPLPANLWIEMSKLSQPGVVGIYLDIDLKKTSMRRDPFFDFVEEFFGQGFSYEDPRSKKDSTPIGTGFLIDNAGHIVTNYHVIEPVDNDRFKTKLQVQIKGQSELLNVEVIGRDPRGDLALLKLNKKVNNLKPLVFGDSDQLQVGEYVAAFGNPYGHTNSMTVGIVSAKGRSLKELNRFPFIQTDASINPGNSGGPLLNTNGYVVGVNSAIDARAQGIGFAIPSNYAKKVIGILKSGGVIQRGFLGIGLANLHPQIARSYGIKKNGIVVANVQPGYPGEKAGLKENDIIYEFGGEPITSSEQFIDLVQDSEVDKSVPIKVLRPTREEFKEVELKITPTSFPGQGSLPKLISKKSPVKKSNEYQGTQIPYDMGFSVVDSSSGARREFDIPIRFPFGPIVTSVIPGSPADRGGIRPGQIVLRVNGQGANKAQDVIQKCKKGVNRFWVHTPRGERKISLKTE